jgi:hypothetical protein
VSTVLERSIAGDRIARVASVEESAGAQVASGALWLAVGAGVGMCVAGFWNVKFVDGLGVSAFVSPVIGAFQGKASRFSELGAGFGALFAVVAGLAATATASSLATFTMLPLLAFAGARSRSAMAAWRLPVIMTGAVTLIGALYGAFIGRMGPDGGAAFNVGSVRGAQSFVVFSALGIVMLGWSAVEGGLLPGVVRRASPITRAFFGEPATKAAVAGAVVGAFAIGRPLAVFHEFLLYAAQPASAGYGAVVMAMQSLASVFIPVALLAFGLTFAGDRIETWTQTSPRRSALVSAGALAAGGAFLIFYWGITREWPALGRWGFQLGIYNK